LITTFVPIDSAFQVRGKKIAGGPTPRKAYHEDYANILDERVFHHRKHCRLSKDSRTRMQLAQLEKYATWQRISLKNQEMPKSYSGTIKRVQSTAFGHVALK